MTSKQTVSPQRLPSELAEILAAARTAVAEAGTTDSLAEVKADLLGRSSRLAALRSAIGSFSADDRPEAGRACNEATSEITALLDARHSELAKAERAALLQTERADLTEVIGDIAAGHSHIITQTRRALEDLFVGMGYAVADGPEIDTEWNNFTALNFPLGHPARDMYDTLYVNWGEPMSTMLRTHTSPVQVRTMTSQPPPIAVVAPGRCFRRDTADATHMPVFHQIEGSADRPRHQPRPPRRHDRSLHHCCSSARGSARGCVRHIFHSPNPRRSSTSSGPTAVGWS